MVLKKTAVYLISMRFNRTSSEFEHSAYINNHEMYHDLQFNDGKGPNLVLQETTYLGVCKLRKLINLVVLTECRRIPKQCFQIVESVDNGRRKTAIEIFSVILFFRGCLGVELSFLCISCCFPYKY
jgi:hypothetical protein